MAVHLRIRHWVIWWFWVGVVLGLVAMVNILMRDLPRPEDRAVVIVSAFFWLIGGVFCYSADGITLETRHEPEHHEQTDTHPFLNESEWHAPSDFLLPGHRKHLLPPRH